MDKKTLEEDPRVLDVEFLRDIRNELAITSKGKISNKDIEKISKIVERYLKSSGMIKLGPSEYEVAAALLGKFDK